MRHATGHNLVP